MNDSTRNAQGDPSDRTRREQRARERYAEVVDRFDDDIGPSPDEIDAWAAREHRRRQEWSEGPLERERLMWARRERMRRLDREAFTAQHFRDEPRVRLSRAGREFQRAAQGAAVEFLSFPFRMFDLLVATGRDSERPTRRSEFDDEFD